jgi:hypothetical protein
MLRRLQPAQTCAVPASCLDYCSTYSTAQRCTSIWHNTSTQHLLSAQHQPKPLSCCLHSCISAASWHDCILCMLNSTAVQHFTPLWQSTRAPPRLPTHLLPAAPAYLLPAGMTTSSACSTVQQCNTTHHSGTAPAQKHTPPHSLAACSSSISCRSAAMMPRSRSLVASAATSAAASSCCCSCCCWESLAVLWAPTAADRHDHLNPITSSQSTVFQICSHKPSSKYACVKALSDSKHPVTARAQMHSSPTAHVPSPAGC